MKAAISFILMALVLTILTYIFTTDELNVGEKRTITAHYFKPFLKIKPLNVRDTVFTMKDSYLELNLKRQKLYHHFRDGRIFEYLCSTGNPYVEKGMKTNEGIFVFQYKTRRAYSTQFDSTLMLNWMGFNFGIGLHSLQSSGYYRYLGRRASSHGCVRLSRENSDEIYRSTEIGTPIIIHSENNARIIAFADEPSRFTIPTKNEIKILLQSNLEKLYKGYYLIEKIEKILIAEDNVNHSGLSIGNLDSIPKFQLHIPLIKLENKLINDKLKVFIQKNILKDSVNNFH